MKFEFSDKTQVVCVHHYASTGEYLFSGEVVIDAHTGLPAQCTLQPLLSVTDEQVSVFKNDTWQVMPDYRGQTAYAKDNDVDADYCINELGALPITHTLTQPKRDTSMANLSALRQVRMSLLIEADHLVNIAVDNGIDESQLRQYRQLLRDITQVYSNLDDVEWPTKPQLLQS